MAYQQIFLKRYSFLKENICQQRDHLLPRNYYFQFVAVAKFYSKCIEEERRHKCQVASRFIFQSHSILYFITWI